MNMTMPLFLRSEPAMYTSPGRTYARVGVRDPARMYVRGVFTFLHPGCTYVYTIFTGLRDMLRARLYYDTCAPLLRHVRASTTTRARLYYDTCPSLHGHGSSLQPADKPIDQYVHTHSRSNRQPYVQFYRVGPSYQGDKEAIPCVRRYSWWVPTITGRIIFFARNMDALPCVQRCSWWVPVVRGANRIFARTHFLAFEDVAGGSQQSRG